MVQSVSVLVPSPDRPSQIGSHAKRPVLSRIHSAKVRGAWPVLARASAEAWGADTDAGGKRPSGRVPAGRADVYPASQQLGEDLLADASGGTRDEHGH